MNGFCNGLRYGENADYTTNLKDKEIIYTIPEVQGCSSSKIRNYLKTHPELYKGTKPLSGTILDRIPPKELDYIIKNKLYYKETLLQKTLGKVNCYITNMFSPIKTMLNIPKKHLTITRA